MSSYLPVKTSSKAGENRSRAQIDSYRRERVEPQSGVPYSLGHRLRTGFKVWVITEADKSGTTFLLSEEYC